ncbi:MBL fold metallo-hydrolase [Candidatus Thiodubiliella endoseptemdiera]|uniref:MBL fold metallo-hydrolase n=1 Tax=Candidatus Thiodubiliella endoseptemdiera TaxID=2738886 RepID=UPI0034DE0A1E
MKKTILLLMLFNINVYASTGLKIEKINDYVYALVGETKQRSTQNLGNNSTHGVVITKTGVIVIDSGASYLGARQIHQAIQTLTDKPITTVINTGGQDHRWLGNDYFKTLGANIIASEKTRNDQIARTDYHLNRLGNLIGDSLKGTKPVYANTTFKQRKMLNISGVHLELYHFGGAHTLGDIFVWMPQEKIMFSGDIVFVQRALGTGPAKNIKSWIKVFEKMASFKPKHIIPGHGHTTNLVEATKDTYDYLVFLRDEVRKVIEEDGDIMQATDINQDAFKYLKNFEGIARKNAQNAFVQLEFEE